MRKTGSPLNTGIRTLGGVIALLALASGALAQDGDPPAPKVSVAAAYTEDLIDEISFIGKGEAIDKVNIIARVDGFLQERQVDDGQKVEEGDLLFIIEPDAYEATLQARQAALGEAEASLELARIELDRKSQLVQREASPQSEEDIAKANEKVAEAQVASAEAAIRSAELDVSYTQITAPFSGRVGRIQRSVGDIVGPSTEPLVTIVRESPMWVTFSLSEKQLIDMLQRIEADVDEVAENDRTPDVFLTLPNGTVLDEVGRLIFIENRIDPTTGSIALRAEFLNEKGLIFDGAFVDVAIQALETDTKLLIPLAAVQRDQRGDFVLVVKSDETVEQRYVTLGKQHEAAVVVQDGMQEGEAVIVEGLQRVRPGAKVDAVLAGRTPEPEQASTGTADQATEQTGD